MCHPRWKEVCVAFKTTIEANLLHQKTNHMPLEEHRVAPHADA